MTLDEQEAGQRAAEACKRLADYYRDRSEFELTTGEYQKMRNLQVAGFALCAFSALVVVGVMVWAIWRWM